MLLVASLAALSSACTHHHRVNPASPGASLDRFARAADGRDGTVTQVGDSATAVRGIRVSGSAVSWSLGGDDARTSVPLVDLERVQVTNRGRGGLEGAGIGAGIAVAFLGASLLFESGDPCSGCDLGDLFLYLTPGAAAVGGVVGYVIGRIVGSRDTLVVEVGGGGSR